MSHITPCADPANDPDDWYITREGKQYSDDDITDEERRAALIRRRKAKDECHTGCYFRLNCLDLALSNNETNGTWGGYTEEELREIRREKARQSRRRSYSTLP